MRARTSYDTDPRVDAYIAGLPDWQQEICDRLRDLIHSVDPEMTETIKRRDRPVRRCSYVNADSFLRVV